MPNSTQNKLTEENLDESKTYYLEGCRLYFSDNQWMFFGDYVLESPFCMAPHFIKKAFLNHPDLIIKNKE